jgi:hypothetical protein
MPEYKVPRKCGGYHSFIIPPYMLIVRAGRKLLMKHEAYERMQHVYV